MSTLNVAARIGTAIQVHGLGKRYDLKNARRVRAHEAIQKVFERALGRTNTPEEPFWAVRDCSFEIRQGEVIALVGRNRAGKSVLLKMLSNVVKPTEGWAEIRGRHISLLELGSGFHEELTGRENVFLNGAILGVRREQMEQKLEEIVDFSGIRRFIDVPVKSYSSGMHMRLAFAVAAHLDAEVLMLDEVLAVGDQNFQEKCLERVQMSARGGATIVMVSHSMEVISQLCTRALYMEAGRIVFDGPAEEAVRRYQEGI